MRSKALLLLALIVHPSVAILTVPPPMERPSPGLNRFLYVFAASLLPYPHIGPAAP